MNIFKKVVVLLLCLAIAFTSIVMVNAQTTSIESRQAQIESLFDKMTETLALSLLEENTIAVQNYMNEVTQIEQQLLHLGVHQVSDSELSTYLARNESDIVMANLSKPADTNTVKWYVYDYIYNSYGSKKYDVQRLVAVGNNPGGTLVTGEDNYEFFSNKPILAQAITTAFSIYAQKAIGTIPYTQLTPYELLFSSSSSNAFNSCYVTHRCVSTIAFSYVKESSQSDDYYTLSFYSNKFSLAATVHGAAVINSVPETYSQNETVTITSDSYNAIIPAIESYLGLGGCYGYVYSYELRCCDGAYSRKVYVPTPLSGPGQVW